MNKIQYLVLSSIIVLTVAAINVTAQNEYDYYLKGTACVAVPETNCISGGVGCRYLDSLTGNLYQLYDSRARSGMCLTPLRTDFP
jgi:hypothetical protein